MLTREEAISKLGTYAYHERTSNVLEQRVMRVVAFSRHYPNFDIVVNRSYTRPPRHMSSKGYMVIGNNSRLYTIWAVAR